VTTLLDMLPLTPDWYALIFALLGTALLAQLWPPLALVVSGLAVLAGTITLLQSARLARHAMREHRMTAWPWHRWPLVALLYLIQPLARLEGRLSEIRPRVAGLSALGHLVIPRQRTVRWTTTTWAPLDQRLRAIDRHARSLGARVRHGMPSDRWDLGAAGGPFGTARLHAAVEEHGHGTQVIRFRVWPRLSFRTLVLAALFVLAASGAALGTAWIGATACVLAVLVLAALSAYEAGLAEGLLLDSVEAIVRDDVGPRGIGARADLPTRVPVLNGAAGRASEAAATIVGMKSIARLSPRTAASQATPGSFEKSRSFDQGRSPWSTSE
jgi:hypothetical protein